MKLLKLVLLLLLSLTPTKAALPVSDSFTDTDGTALATHNASWTVIVGAFEVNGTNLLRVPDGTTGTCLARWATETFPNNQFAQGTKDYTTYDTKIGLAVRVSTAGATSAYVLRWNNTTFELGKLVTGTWTTLASGSAPAIYSVMRLEAEGTTIRAYDDTVEIASVTDATLAAGGAGVYGEGGTGSVSYVDTWSAGDLTGGGAPGGPSNVITVCASGCDETDLQTAINAAAAANSGPRIIVLAAGETFSATGGYTLPARSGTYTGWITIRSSRISELPARTRVTPGDVTKMAKVTFSNTTLNVYYAALYTIGRPSSYWRLEGLEFTLPQTGLRNYGAIVNLGFGGMDQLELEPSKVSHHFVIDRCYIHGFTYDNGPRDGVVVNADNVEILNSYISEIHRDDMESHGILGYSLNGPLLVRNTFHGGAAIGSLVGGAGSTSVTIQPNSTKFLGNHYQGTPTHRALRWAGPPQGITAPPTCSSFVVPEMTIYTQTYWNSSTKDFFACDSWVAGHSPYLIATGVLGNVCIDGDFWEDTNGPTYYRCAGGQWVSESTNRTITGGTYTPFKRFWSKNRFELKKVSGALVEGNLIENCFSPTEQSQACGAILLNWVTDQDGPWATIRDVKIQNNVMRRTVGMINEGGIISHAQFSSYGHRWPRHVSLDNNLMQDGNNPGILTAVNKVTYYYTPPITTGVGGVGIVGMTRDSQFTHNTIINPLASTNFWPESLAYHDGEVTGRTIADNIYETGSTNTVMKFVSTGGCDAFTETAGRWTGSNLRKNIAVQVGQSAWSGNSTAYDTTDCRTWAWPWKRDGDGVKSAVASASISGGALIINFGGVGGGGHGLLQGTKVKLAGWSPAGLNTTYTIPRYWCGSGSELTRQTYQSQDTLCLTTAETGAVTPGTVEASLDYTDYSALNFRLAATSAYKGWATDGSDPGVNQDVVEWATATSASGADNPYLDFRVRAIVPTSDGALFRYTAYSTAACTWTASSTRAHADDVSASFSAETRLGRDGSITVSGLASDTTYWFQATCNSKTRDGEFTTTH